MSKAALEAAIATRGPDGRGEFNAEGVTLLHTRLAIQDVTAASDQPFRFGDKWLAWNGEVYNQADLRRELESLGRKFLTTGDTEVLAQSLDQWGVGALERLRGMFALAWWDGSQRSLLLARDRFGMKPLYFRNDPELLRFCSVTRPLLSGGGVDQVTDLLSTGSFREEIGDSVEEVPPGAWLRRDPSGVTRGSYAVEPTIGNGPLRQSFEASVAGHLVSDVPVAHLLSGGVDSTAIALAAARLGHRLTCFTLSRDQEDWEPEVARQTALRYGHDFVLLPPIDDIRDTFENFVQTVDLPSIDGFNVYLVAAAISDAGFKVALSGTGGDEVLGGYRTFRRLLPFALLSRLPTSVAEKVLATMRLGSIERERMSVPLRTRSIEAFHRASRSLFTPSEIAGLTDAAPPPISFASPVPFRHLLGGRWSRDLARYEIDEYLRFTLLRDGDNFGMAHGVEMRFPFVDHLFAPVAISTLSAYPRAGKRYFVKRMDDPWLRTVSRRPKRGFDLPLDRWMRGPLRERVESIEPILARAGFKRDGVGAIVRGWLNGSVPSIKPWALLNLSVWLQRQEAGR